MPVDFGSSIATPAHPQGYFCLNNWSPTPTGWNICFTAGMDVVEGKNVLVTGGTGTFGRHLIQELLESHNPKKIVVFSRDEMKQWGMMQELTASKKLRFFIGDVRDSLRLRRAFQGIQVVFHAAANKIVPSVEYNPMEAVKTNILGAMNVIDAALDCGVERVIALSTDKASSPVNLYGATKLVSDKLFASSHTYSGASKTKFASVRYGNVMGSRGSVIPLFLSRARAGLPLPITDERMTRFMIRVEDGVQLAIRALENMAGGEIFVAKIPSMKVVDIAEAIDPGGLREIVGIRQGEKLHEEMISMEEASRTMEFAHHFVIQGRGSLRHVKAGEQGQPVYDAFRYASDTNAEWMSQKELRTWLGERNLLPT